MRSGRQPHSLSARVIHWCGITPYQRLNITNAKAAAAIASAQVRYFPTGRRLLYR